MNDSLATIAEEIIMVRKLAVFALLNSGVSQEKVAGALGVSQATISLWQAPRKETGPQSQRKRPNASSIPKNDPIRIMLVQVTDGSGNPLRSVVMQIGEAAVE